MPQDIPDGIGFNTSKLFIAWEIVKASRVLRDPQNGEPPTLEALLEAFNRVYDELGDAPKKAQ